MGPYRIPASCGALYFLTIVDDRSRAVWIYLLNRKNDVASVLKNFIVMINRQFEKNVKVIRSDNGTEFTCLKGYFAEYGIGTKLLVLGHPIEWMCRKKTSPHSQYSKSITVPGKFTH